MFGEFTLALFGGQARGQVQGGIFEFLAGQLVLEFIQHEVHQGAVEVITAQARVATGGQDTKDTILDGQDRNIEGAAAEVVDSDVAACVLVESIGQTGGGGLVDDAQHIEAGEARGVAGGLALRIIEVGRHGDDGLLDFGTAHATTAEAVHAHQDHRGKLLGGVLLAVGLDAQHTCRIFHDREGQGFQILAHILQSAAEETLDGENRVARVHDGLGPRCMAHGVLALLWQ